ncbi:hypothetical protein D9V84_10985 [Bacteroidetes/Chlorobi group bacterium Naka2016]|nr:MAG: hypothetical protein D9V84_10985 [Bacteroidetes/Chlorobi group bacterium Naka2016]
MRSVLEDSNLNQTKKIDILGIIKNKTRGNVTFISPQSPNPNENFSDVFKNFLKDFYVIGKIDPNDLLSELSSTKINHYDFCLLFWEGTSSGANRHVTRFCKLQNNDVFLMDPKKGKCDNFKIQDLTNISPNGFWLILFSFL